MGLINIIRGINNLFPKPPVHTPEEEREMKRKIISRYSDGQTSLYFGNSKTSLEKARLKGYDFLEGIN